MNRATVVIAAAILVFACSADAKGLKGVVASIVAARVGQAQPAIQAWPGPDVEVAVPVGKAKADSLRIRVVGTPWPTPYGKLPSTRLGDRLFPGDIHNLAIGLLRARRDAFRTRSDIFGLNRGIRNRMNALSMYVSVTDGGGLGFRVLYDRRLRPSIGLNVSGEFTTYDGIRLTRLQTSFPNYTGRLSVIGLYAGLQQRLVDRGRVVPRVGFAAGPIIRLDHQEPPFYGGYYSPYGGVSGGYGTNGLSTGIGFPIGDFPSLSLSFGGYANAGLDVVVGQDRLYALSLDARYNLIRFFDSLGNPGDFGGPALYLGFGRRF